MFPDSPPSSPYALIILKLKLSSLHHWSRIPEKWLKQKYKYIAEKSESQLRTKEEKEMKRRLTTLASELSEVDKEMIVEKYQGEV